MGIPNDFNWRRVGWEVIRIAALERLASEPPDQFTAKAEKDAKGLPEP
jgi:hypothetical protein